MKQVVRIGTRASKLAMWQAYYVEEKLREAGFDTQIIALSTKGDRVLDVSISKIGSKGVFTEEIEEQLAKGAIDMAVHSAKDMPSHLPDGFELIAFTKREQANDVLLSFQKGLQLENREMIIGTSSTRRIAFLKHYFPKIKTMDIRGNLQTRMEKLKQGPYDGVLLAYAGVHRMEMDERITQHLDMDHFVPPTGQGSICIEVYKGLSEDLKQGIRAALHDRESGIALAAERAYLASLHGGCSIPVFAHAKEVGPDQWQMKAGIISLDGQEKLEEEARFGTEDAVESGRAMALKILKAGGDRILQQIRKSLD